MTVAEDNQRGEKPEVTSSDSKTKVHFSESAVYKYLSGKREPISIRIDTGLYSVFKPLSKRIYGSTCKAIEVYMITLIEAVEKGVHFSDTPQQIEIGKIVIERNLRERRGLELEENRETSKSKTECGFVNCQKEAVEKAIWLPTNKQYDLCSLHIENALSQSKLWKVIQS